MEKKKTKLKDFDEEVKETDVALVRLARTLDTNGTNFFWFPFRNLGVLKVVLFGIGGYFYLRGLLMEVQALFLLIQFLTRMT